MVAATIRKIHAPNQLAAVFEVSGSPDESSRSGALLPLSPLRTARASFPAYGSSNIVSSYVHILRNQLAVTFSVLVFDLPFAGIVDEDAYLSVADTLVGDAPSTFRVDTFPAERAHLSLTLPNGK